MQVGGDQTFLAGEVDVEIATKIALADHARKIREPDALATVVELAFEGVGGRGWKRHAGERIERCKVIPAQMQIQIRASQLQGTLDGAFESNDGLAVRSLKVHGIRVAGL